jgi:poly(3-hydroxybutyrate) depolymerase
MARRKSPLVSALFKLTRAGVRQSTKIGKAATRQGIAAGGRMASSARHVMSGIATPADAPAAVTGGRWHEGRWGLGPLAMRRYRLFIPTGASTRRPIPLAPAAAWLRPGYGGLCRVHPLRRGGPGAGLSPC